MFALATALVTPKLLIHIFIGSRLAAIAKSGEKMVSQFLTAFSSKFSNADPEAVQDAGTKAINWMSIILGMIIGAGTGWLIYRRYVVCMHMAK